MTEGIEFGLKKGLLVESGKHGLSAAFQAVGLSRWPQFWSVGLVVVGLACSATAHLPAVSVLLSTMRIAMAVATISAGMEAIIKLRNASPRLSAT